MPTTATTSRLSPAKWRVLNCLFYAPGHEMLARPLLKSQVCPWETLVGMDNDRLIVATVGAEGYPINLADLSGPGAVAMAAKTTILLAPHGRGLVVNDPRNQVICVLGHQSGNTATARSVKTEADVKDHTLIGMAEDGLIETFLDGAAGSPRLLRQIPPDMEVHLTRKGLAYFPR